MVEEEKIIITGSSNMMVGTTTKGFEPPYHHVNDSFFFNFDQQQHNPSSDLFWKPTTSSSAASKAPAAGDFCQLEEDQSRSCVLINPNERPSQGLSLSLSSTNPSTIGIQSFLSTPPPQNPHHHHQAATYNSSAKSMYMHIDDHMIMTHDHEPPAVAAADDDDDFFRKPGDSIMDSTGSGVVKYQSAPLYNLRSSRYLLPAQHLLNEFCNLGSKQNTHSITKAKAQVTNQPQDHDHNDINIATSSKSIPLSSIEYMELQKRKTKLLQMLDEVDRKYHNYCDKMKAVVLSFEAVAGNGAATVYSTLASKAMSRHFRCLRDGVAGQIKATKKAMGEKDISTGPGATATRGETPRLKLLDQTLRQQRAFHQMITMDSHPWRPQRGLPERSVSVLRAWLFEHFLHPYPSDVDKHILARQTGLSRSQVSNWFINARVRLWKPMVEEMYMEETKDHENVEDKFNAHVTDENTAIPKMEQKPSIDDQLIIRNDSDSLNISSFINRQDHHTEKTLEHDAINQSFPRVSADSFGTVELDFSTYNRNFDVNGGGVSLNLGLQQHASGGRSEDGGGGGGGGGSSLYYPRDSFDQDCQTAVLEYNSSVLEGDQIQGQNLPYRNNLIEAQLLHDLAG